MPNESSNQARLFVIKVMSDVNNNEEMIFTGIDEVHNGNGI